MREVPLKDIVNSTEGLLVKADKEELLRNGTYSGSRREDIARRFGRLLSYPEDVIDDLIARNKSSS